MLAHPGPTERRVTSGKAKTCSITGSRFRYRSAMDSAAPARMDLSSESVRVCTCIAAGSPTAACAELATGVKSATHSSNVNLAFTKTDLAGRLYDLGQCIASRALQSYPFYFCAW